jgi:hypothetical protein
MKLKSIAHKILALGGFHAFLFTAGTGPLLITTLVIMTAVLFAKLVYKKSCMHLLFPLASGLLFLPMKLFYWDKADYVNRINNLLLISLLLIGYMAVKEFKLLPRFIRSFTRLSLKKQCVYIFIFVEILFILSSFIITEKGVQPGGDEPHYLVVSHSIARDFDLNVFNQYARDEYREFMDVPLAHHARVGKGFKRWFSYGHLPGLSVTLTPFFIFKIPHPLLYFLIRSYLGLFGAMLAVLVYRISLKLWKHRPLSIFVTAVFAFTTPVFFHSIHIFAELQAALLIISSLYLLLFAEKKTGLTVLIAGLLLSVTVFWGMKYTIFILLLSGGFFFYFIFKKREWKNAFLMVLFPVLLQVLFFYYLYNAYGNFDPMSIYNGVMTDTQKVAYNANMEKIPLQKRVETLLGIFFDQRDGLIPYNPFYLFFFPGLIIAFQKFKTYLPHLLIAAAGFGFVFFMGYSTVRAGYCPQARYLVPAIWALMLFAVIYRNETRNRLFKQFFYTIPLYSLFVTVYQVFYPFTLYQDATHTSLIRPGLMFQQWSNAYLNIPGFLPSFVKVPGNFQYVPNILFLVLILVFVIFSLLKIPRLKLNWIPPVLFGLLFLLTALFPRVPRYNPILLTRGDTSPCKIYGENPFPTRAEERKFPLVGTSNKSFTVSTLEPASAFVFEFENNGSKPFDFYISNFDRELKELKSPAGKTEKITVQSPRYKKFKNAYFYRFHIRVSPVSRISDSLFIQLYSNR